MTERQYKVGDELWIRVAIAYEQTHLHQGDPRYYVANEQWDKNMPALPKDLRTEADFKGPHDQTIIDAAVKWDSYWDYSNPSTGWADKDLHTAVQAKLDATAHAPSAAEIINSHLYFDGMSDNGMLICKGCKEEHTDYAGHIAAKLAAAGRLVESDES